MPNFEDFFFFFGRRVWLFGWLQRQLYWQQLNCFWVSHMGVCSPFQPNCSLSSLFPSHRFSSVSFLWFWWTWIIVYLMKTLCKYFMKPLQVIFVAEMQEAVSVMDILCKNSFWFLEESIHSVSSIQLQVRFSEGNALRAFFNVMGFFTVLYQCTNACPKLFCPRTPCKLEIWIAFQRQRGWQGKI